MKKGRSPCAAVRKCSKARRTAFSLPSWPRKRRKCARSAPAMKGIIERPIIARAGSPRISRHFPRASSILPWGSSRNEISQVAVIRRGPPSPSQLRSTSNSFPCVKSPSVSRRHKGKSRDFRSPAAIARMHQAKLSNKRQPVALLGQVRDRRSLQQCRTVVVGQSLGHAQSCKMLKPVPDARRQLPIRSPMTVDPKERKPIASAEQHPVNPLDLPATRLPTPLPALWRGKNVHGLPHHRRMLRQLWSGFRTNPCRRRTGLFHAFDCRPYRRQWPAADGTSVPSAILVTGLDLATGHTVSLPRLVSLHQRRGDGCHLLQC